MPVFAKKVESTDKRFAGRAIEVYSRPSGMPRDVTITTKIPVSDVVILCNGCNGNIYPNPGYLLYLSRRDLNNDQPYDFYCKNCLERYFPKVQTVE